MQQYLDLLSELRNCPLRTNERTGEVTASKFGHLMRFDLSEGFPMVTTKKVPFRHVVGELIWFLSGDTNTKYLEDNGITIWREWQDDRGCLGPVYGAQWRYWPEGYGEHGDIDQISTAIENIKSKPYDRGHLVSAWNVADLPNMALRPCHYAFQFYVGADNRLSCAFSMRSSDVFLGLPWNIASYALLTHMVAVQTGYEVGELIYFGADVHLYQNHFEQANLQLSREPRSLPKLVLVNQRDSISDYTIDDFKLDGYDPWPAIKAEVAV